MRLHKLLNKIYEHRKEKSITVKLALFPSTISDAKSLSVELAAMLNIHGARFVAEPWFPSFPTEATPKFHD